MVMAVAEYDALRRALPDRLRTAVRAAMDDCMKLGMSTEEATEVVVIAAADLARANFGDHHLRILANIVMARVGLSFSEEQQ